MVAVTDPNIEELELRLFYIALQEKYEVDLSDYRQAYILRRLKRRMQLDGYDSITLITNRILRDTLYAEKLMKDMSINVTDMFRCPEFYKSLKTNVFPILQTYPSIQIWHAGCATGEEVISLAILLKEANLYDRATIVATDINEDAMQFAQKAIYPITKMKQWTENYSLAGGEESFSSYYDVKYNHAIFDPSLLERVTFLKQNLTKDAYPKHMHLILCRNVFIYFNKTLQDDVATGFHKALVTDGYLGLGLKENIYANNLFSYVDRTYKIYKKL